MKDERIWKFEFEVADRVVLNLPEDAEILHVGIQNPLAARPLAAWVRLDVNAPKKHRTLHVYGTGHIVRSTAGRHLGTVQTLNGLLVWHVFEASEQVMEEDLEPEADDAIPVPPA